MPITKIRPVFQDRFERLGQNGNCAQAAFASILDMPLWAVPNFVEQRDYDGAIDRFLLGRGLRLKERPVGTVPPGYYLAAGTSTQGYEHLCVYLDGRLAHDPNPEGAGLVKVTAIYQLVPA